LYILYLAIDANFKLKGKDRKITDIELALGLGVFVNETQYQEFLKAYVDEPEVNLLMFSTYFGIEPSFNINT
jgi:hypothetical protein